jgi:hypothetical protein
MATTHCVEAMRSDNIMSSQTLNELEDVSGEFNSRLSTNVLLTLTQMTSIAV